MSPKNLAVRHASLGDISRRDLLTGALAGAAAFAASGPVAGSHGGRAKNLAYVGCYTPNGLGIYLFGVESDGDLRPIKVFTTPSPSPTSVSATNPSWLAFSPGKTHLYVANEIGNFNNTPAGAVSAFSVNRADGELTFLNTVSSEGRGPAHLSVDPSGAYVLVSNYGGGKLRGPAYPLRWLARIGDGCAGGREHVCVRSLPGRTPHRGERAARQFRQKRTRRAACPHDRDRSGGQLCHCDGSRSRYRDRLDVRSDDRQASRSQDVPDIARRRPAALRVPSQRCVVLSAERRIVDACVHALQPGNGLTGPGR